MERLVLQDLESDCPYIEGNRATTESFVSLSVSPGQLDRLLESGFRHFGYYFFRPVCRACTRCIPIRVVLDAYRHGTSARRLLRRNRGLTVFLGTLQPTRTSFELYLRHLERFEKKGADSYDEYVRSFFFPSSTNQQLSVFDGDRLVSVMHLDVTTTAMSLVYCYYDDSYRRESLGRFSILKSIELAHVRRLSFVYLGYLVPENRHMSYKARYKPSQVLTIDGWKDYLDAEGNEVTPGVLDGGFPARRLRQRTE